MAKYSYTEKKDTRSGFGAGLLEAGKQNDKVVALCADLTGSLKMGDFQKEFPQRFFQSGIAEANMIGVSAGLTIGGMIPFCGTFAGFATGRVYDQIRQSVAYSNKNVKKKSLNLSSCPLRAFVVKYRLVNCFFFGGENDHEQHRL